MKIHFPFGAIQSYVTFLTKVFGEMEVINTIDETIDLVVFTGGSDVNPKYYGETCHSSTHFNDKRDKLEIKAYKQARELSIPMLGICRGAQFLTVMNGGRLIQDVTNHAGMVHEIIFLDKDYNETELPPVEIRSTHHQMMYPYNLSRDSYRVIAGTFERSTQYTKDELNTQYLDMFGLPEPEIVEYPNTQCLCIQGHPEMIFGGTGYNTLVEVMSILIKSKVLNHEQVN